MIEKICKIIDDDKAIMELSRFQNTEIKVSYNLERTRLHEKAYLLRIEN